MSKLSTEIKGKYRNRVLQIRLQKEIKTQKDLAGRTGIRQSILCDIESNKLFLSSIYALKIADVLGCSINDLYERRN